MRTIKNLLDANRQWAENIKKSDPDFFAKLSEIQSPEFLWIGCSDSRITPSSSVGLLPGEMFVHRNVANLVIHSDMNCLSALHFAVEALRVRHIIVCGHYGCGGIKAAIENDRFGLIDNWLRHIQDTIFSHRLELNKLADPEKRFERLCEINVAEQVINVGETTIVREAWERRQEIFVHGWIYAISDGIYRDMNISISGPEELTALRTSIFSG